MASVAGPDLHLFGRFSLVWRWTRVIGRKITPCNSVHLDIFLSRDPHEGFFKQQLAESVVPPLFL